MVPYSRFMLVLALALACSAPGCGGGNKLFVQGDGAVEHGELDLSKLPSGESAGDTYRISHGDVVDISFLYNEDLSRQGITVRPDGRISYPYAGEIMAAGMTVPQLDSVLTERFSEIVREPEISVIVREFVEPMVYVLGSVSSAGGFPWRRGMTLMSALALGRGPNSDARRNGVLVIRRVAPDRVVGIQIDVGELTGGHRFDLDIPLEPYDIVFVPRSRVASAADFVENLYTLLSRPMDLYIKGWQTFNQKTLYDFYKRTGARL